MSVIPAVTFETKCWEKDWEILCKSNRIERILRHQPFPFKERILFINNVKEYAAVSRYAQKLVDRGILTKFYRVREHEEEVLGFFRLSRESFRGGFYYSIAELTAIYLCATDYLYHLSSDTFLPRPVPNDWIHKSIKRFDSDQHCKVANLTWNFAYDQARREAVRCDDDFYYGKGFSDQHYLIRTSDFRAPIYNTVHPDQHRYPAYGGELFEKRVNAWMLENGYLRLTYKHASSYHKNFHHIGLLNKILLYTGHFNRRWH